MASKPFDVVDVLQSINTAAYMLTIVVGVAGNLWVAWKIGVVLLFDKSISVPRQIMYCILGICCADLLVLCDLLLLVHFQLTKNWIFGSPVCKIFYSIEIINKLVIPLGLVQVSRVSYRSVRLCQKPSNEKVNILHFLLYFTSAGAVLILMGFVLYFAELRTVRLRRGTSITVCLFDPPQYYQTVFNLLAFVVGYIMTSVSYVYFYLKVPLLLSRQISSSKNASKANRLNDRSLNRIRRTVTCFVVVYLSCWTPYWAAFWFLSLVNIVERWLVVVSSFAHLLPYISCTAYPIILTAMNKSIRSTHSSIMNDKRKQLSTIRLGAMQAMSAHLGMVQSWMKDDTERTLVTLTSQSDVIL